MAVLAEKRVSYLGDVFAQPPAPHGKFYRQMPVCCKMHAKMAAKHLSHKSAKQAGQPLTARKSNSCTDELHVASQRSGEFPIPALGLPLDFVWTFDLATHVHSCAGLAGHMGPGRTAPEHQLPEGGSWHCPARSQFSQNPISQMFTIFKPFPQLLFKSFLPRGAKMSQMLPNFTRVRRSPTGPKVGHLSRGIPAGGLNWRCQGLV